MRNAQLMDVMYKVDVAVLEFKAAVVSRHEWGILFF